ncbi:hypothetical protein [Primorskyibacter sp. S87]|uniref:hypothetical protein n=1 Tax=Primorskyibacter sp. S87 TaxID=3415126 RepID=UPI003C7997B9
MHRKFIALIVSLAMAVTGMSIVAAPAQADQDVAKIIAGLTALALIGVAIDRHNHRKDQVTSHSVQPATPPRGQGTRGNRVQPRPLPDRVARYALPRHCLRTGPGGQAVLSRRCLQRSYGYAGTLPKSCRVRHWDRERTRKGYSVQCLKNRGYRLTRH